MANLTAAQYCALDCDLTDREFKRFVQVMFCSINTAVVASAPTPFAVAHTESIVAVTATSSTILASYATRSGGYIKNTSVIDVYLSLGGTASTSGTGKVAPGEVYTIPRGYTGPINAVRAAGAGTFNVEVVDW